jgi:DNA-binding SARP family transcriptional activator
MRCLVSRGERAQALRQYRLCEGILRAEFNAEPEAETEALYEQIRRAAGHAAPTAGQRAVLMSRDASARPEPPSSRRPTGS